MRPSETAVRRGSGAATFFYCSSARADVRESAVRVLDGGKALGSHRQKQTRPGISVPRCSVLRSAVLCSAVQPGGVYCSLV